MAAERPNQTRQRLKELRLLLAVFLLAIPVLAATHPVPLDKNTDSAKCIECHADKAKGKAVHSAIALGCTSCHEIRVNRDVTRVKLITTTTSGLCLSCHADKNAAEIKGVVHSPAMRDCVKCHDPHVSDNKNQLLKPTSGDEKENLCLSCHKIGLNVAAKGSRHAALDMGCETCHTTHKTGQRGRVEFDFYLTKAAPALCLDCHDPKDESLQKAHQKQPFASANCIQCHDPHQSSAPKLLQAFRHNPFENMLCDTCHEPAKDGKVVLAKADVKSLCVSCHEDRAKEIESAAVPHPGAAGDCTDCHDPHAGRTPGFVKPDPVNACLNCHTDQAEDHKKRNLHQPAFEQGCATCHEPHGGSRARLLRAEDNGLCLECHGTEANPQKVEGENLITIFGGKVRLPQDYFQKKSVVRFQLRYGIGHPTENHPVVNVRDPLDQTKIVTEVNCLSCHQPHAGAARAMLVKDQVPGLEFCRNCHKGMIGTQ